MYNNFLKHVLLRFAVSKQFRVLQVYRRERIKLEYSNPGYIVAI